MYLIMNDFYTAYAEYLERMYDESDELVLIIEDTIPDTINLDRILEWGIIN